MKADCVFCKIVAGAIPSPRVHEDEEFICIRDISPQAKTHLLVIPKLHVASLADSSAELNGKLLAFAAQAALETGLLPAGFRTVINTGAGGGQTVFHLHAHLLGGEQLGEKL